MGEKDNDVCCSDGNLECGNDDDGEEYSPAGMFNWKCCDECIGDSPSDYCDYSASYYADMTAAGVVDKRDGPIALCSSVGAACFKCENMQQGMEPPSGSEEDGKTPQQQCQQEKGMCKYDDDSTPLYINSYPLSEFCEGSCTNSNNEVNVHTSQFDCESQGSCNGSASAGGFHDQLSCENQYWCEGIDGNDTNENSSEDCSGTWKTNTWVASVWRAASFVGGTWTPIPDQDYATCESQGVGFECKVRVER